MFKHIVPVLIVALTAIAAVGSANAASNKQAAASQTVSASPYNPSASSDDYSWWKDR